LRWAAGRDRDGLIGRFIILLDDCVPEYCKSRVLVLGCGNILFGDDGFGPAVVEHLQSHYTVPDDVCVLDVGTGARDVLCTVALSPVKPQRIVVIDAADTGRKPGELFVAPVEDFPQAKGGSFSLHQLPTSSLLKELKDCCQIDILLLTVQPQSIPEAVVPGLSQKVEAAVTPVCQYIVESCL